MATKNTKKSNQKNSQGPDLLTMVVVLIAVVLVLVLISKYKKEKDGATVGQPTGAAPVTEAVVPDTPTPEVTQDTVAPTKAPTAGPDEEVTPEAPTPTEEPVLS